MIGRVIIVFLLAIPVGYGGAWAWMAFFNYVAPTMERWPLWALIGLLVASLVCVGLLLWQLLRLLPKRQA